MLVAHYRKAAASGTADGTTGGGSEVWKVEADGNVRIVSTEETAYGEKAVYTIDDGALIMSGGNLKLVTPRETITARDRLEYWDKKNIAVARGDALTITEDGRRIRADTLTALFKPQGAAKPAPAPTRVASNSAAANRGAASRQPRGDSRLDRMDAVGNVVITTPEEVARGERGVYFEDSGIATLTGSVKITRRPKSIERRRGGSEFAHGSQPDAQSARPQQRSGARPAGPRKARRHPRAEQFRALQRAAPVSR